MDEYKICKGTKNIKGCDKNLDISSFYTNIKTGQIQNLCKNCMNTYNKSRRKIFLSKDDISEMTDEIKTQKEGLFLNKENFYLEQIYELKERIHELKETNKELICTNKDLINTNKELIEINKNLSEKILFDKPEEIKDEISVASSKKTAPNISKSYRKINVEKQI